MRKNYREGGGGGGGGGEWSSWTSEPNLPDRRFVRVGGAVRALKAAVSL